MSFIAIATRVLFTTSPSLTDCLPRLMLKPANVTHLWIEEDLYTKYLGLISLIAVAKASLAGAI